MRVIVFTLNGCPAAWLGAYGNEWVGTPNLDRLAAEGVVFDRHIADRPEPHRLLTLPFGPRLSALTKTVLVRANHPDTDAPDEFYAGWGEVFDARPRPDDDSPLAHLLESFPGLLDRLTDVPDYLLWIETDRLLPPWDVPQDVFEAYVADEEEEPPKDDFETDEADEEADEVDEFDDGAEEPEEHEAEEHEAPESAIRNPQSAIPEEPVVPWADPPTGPFDRADLDAWDWLHHSFAAVVTKLDAELGALFDVLRSRGLDQSAAWVVTSDFGHPLGEHGQVGLYRPWLHEELVHVPLLLRFPGGAQAGRRVAALTQPPDLLPTLHAIAGGASREGEGGFDLLPLARGEVGSVRAVACSALELGDAAEIAIRTGDWALLVPTRVPDGDPPREPQLYNKPDDRFEVNDIRTRNIELADELEVKLREALGQPRG